MIPKNNTLAIYVLKICPIWLRIQRGKDERKKADHKRHSG